MLGLINRRPKQVCFKLLLYVWCLLTSRPMCADVRAWQLLFFAGSRLRGSYVVNHHGVTSSPLSHCLPYGLYNAEAHCIYETVAHETQRRQQSLRHRHPITGLRIILQIRALNLYLSHATGSDSSSFALSIRSQRRNRHQEGSDLQLTHPDSVDETMRRRVCMTLNAALSPSNSAFVLYILHALQLLA